MMHYADRRCACGWLGRSTECRRDSVTRSPLCPECGHATEQVQVADDPARDGTPEAHPAWFRGYEAAVRERAPAGRPLPNGLKELSTGVERATCYGCGAETEHDVTPPEDCAGGKYYLRRCRACGWYGTGEGNPPPVDPESAQVAAVLRHAAEVRAARIRAAERHDGPVENLILRYPGLQERTEAGDHGE